MKASITKHSQVRLHVTAYETGDQPADAVDVPPALLNELQKANLAVTNAEGRILAHLAQTGQRMGRKR